MNGEKEILWVFHPCHQKQGREWGDSLPVNWPDQGDSNLQLDPELCHYLAAFLFEIMNPSLSALSLQGMSEQALEVSNSRQASLLPNSGPQPEFILTFPQLYMYP